jgi:predicted esterase
MVHREARAQRARAMAFLCTSLGMAAMIVAPLARSSSGPPPREDAPPEAPAPPRWIEAPVGRSTARAFVVPPRGGAPPARPVTVLLHGLGGHPESACAPFVAPVTERGWLVCPAGEDPSGAGLRWRTTDDDRDVVEATLRALATRRPGEVDEAAPKVLVGFSLGGIAALRIAESAPGGYAGLVVIASQIHPDADALIRRGVRRVVLAAGDLDMTSAPLRADAVRLARSGLQARFVSLGRFGHGYPPDMEATMREPMAWVAADD